MSESLMNAQLTSLLENETNSISNLANASALLMTSLNNINWAGFYLYHGLDHVLDLGPFQGKVACMHITIGQGVCGTAFETKSTQRVADVHQFKGHIACDSDSQSEIVIPLIVGEQLIGVMDIDSPRLNHFSQNDQVELEEFARILALHLDDSL